MFTWTVLVMLERKMKNFEDESKKYFDTIN